MAPWVGGFLTCCWHSCTPGSIPGHRYGVQEWLPAQRHPVCRATPCCAVAATQSECDKLFHRCVGCCRRYQTLTHISNLQPGPFHPATTAHHCTPLQSRSPTSNSQPRQRIPLAVVMPCNLALQRVLVPAEAGCSPACHEAVPFCCQSVPSIPDWFLQKPCAPTWEGTGRVGCRLCIAPLLLFFTVEINLEIKSIIKKETHPLLSPPLPSPSSDGE